MGKVIYWCLVGNGWEWGNEMIITSDYGSFPHSLLSTSKNMWEQMETHETNHMGNGDLSIIKMGNVGIQLPNIGEHSDLTPVELLKVHLDLMTNTNSVELIWMEKSGETASCKCNGVLAVSYSNWFYMVLPQNLPE